MNLNYNFILHRQKNKKVFDYLKDQMFWSARLYNQVLNIHEEMYRNCSVSYNYYMMERLARQLVVNNYYYKVKTSVSQQVIKSFYQDLTSYFKAIKEFKANPDKFNGLPKPPQYKKRYNTCIFTYSCIAIKDGKIYPTKDLAFDLPQNNIHNFVCTQNKNRRNVKDVRFKYLSKDKIKVIINYETDELNPELDKDNYISVDLGSRGLMTVVSKDKSFIFDGKYIGELHLP